MLKEKIRAYGDRAIYGILREEWEEL